MEIERKNTRASLKEKIQNNMQKESSEPSVSGEVTTPAISNSSRKRRGKGRAFFWLLFLLILAGLVYSQYELYKMKDPAYQQKVAQAETQSVVNKVAKLIVLPQDTPQILTLQDVNTLKEKQPFFKDAENGDLVLVYADIAVIYSPSKNKIVNVGPVVRDNGTTTATANISASTTQAQTTTKTSDTTSTSTSKTKSSK